MTIGRTRSVESLGHGTPQRDVPGFADISANIRFS